MIHAALQALYLHLNRVHLAVFGERFLHLGNFRKSPASDTARTRTSEVLSFCSISCSFSTGEVSTPVERTTIVFLPGNGASQSIADARLEDKFSSAKPSVKFRLCSANSAVGLSGVKSSSSSGSFE